MRKSDNGGIYLSMKRTDGEPMGDWRVKQEIKNILVGEETEFVELYPAESRLVDTANQYHLFGFSEPGLRFPFGFNEAADKIGGKQRKR